ncbi:MAG: Rad52/Rad22 family DNA repair protein [Gemmataceae bacterium]
MAKSESRAVLAEADVNTITQALSAPFDVSEVKFKPQAVSGNRALAVPFVDARVIQDRLDEVLGVMGWQDSYECLPDGAVVCRLRVRVGGEWITKEDVGGQSEQPDEGDRRKAAFSDALKRAAVKFGIGRYLYRCKPQWVDYDPQKRQILKAPTLPAPAGETLKIPEPAGRKQARSKAESAAPAARGKPANGIELHKRLAEKDARLASEGVCQEGELIKFVVAAGQKAGYEKDLATWSGEAIDLAIEQTQAFEAMKRPAKKDVA